MNKLFTVIKKLKEKFAIVAFVDPISFIDVKNNFKCIEFMKKEKIIRIPLIRYILIIWKKLYESINLLILRAVDIIKSLNIQFLADLCLILYLIQTPCVPVIFLALSFIEIVD